MNKLSLNNKGFGFVGVLVVILVLAAVGGAGVYVWHRKHEKKTSTTNSSSDKGASTGNPSMTTMVSSADGKVRVTLSSMWEIISSRSDAQTIDTSTDPSCFTVDNPNPCSYGASFAPKSLSTTQLWALRVGKTTQTPQQVIESIIGQPQAANVVAQSSNSINGYTAYYVEYKTPNTDIYYAIAHNGYVALFTNSQLDDQSSHDTRINTPSSPYLADFDSIAKSVKLDF